MEQVTQPFAETQFFSLTQVASAVQHSDRLPLVVLTVWACGLWG